MGFGKMGARGGYGSSGLLGSLRSFWLSTTRYTAAGAPLPCVIANHRTNQYALPALGAENVVNGTFTNGVTGWTQTSSTAVVVGGEAQVTATAVNGRLEEFFSNLTIGKLYRVTGFARLISGGGSVSVAMHGNTGLSFVIVGGSAATATNSPTAFEFYFTASDPTGHLLQLAMNTSGAVGGFSNISVKEVQLGDVGAELVNNASWSMSVNGGTGTATNSPQGTLNLTGDGTHPASSTQSFATVVGQAYQLIFNVANNACAWEVGTAAFDGSTVAPTASTVGINVASFIATTTNTVVTIYRATATVSTVSAISLRSWTPNPVLRQATFNEVYAYTAAGTTSRSYVGIDGLLHNDLAVNQPRFTYENGVRQHALNNAATNILLQSEGVGVTSPWANNNMIVGASAPQRFAGKTTPLIVPTAGSALHYVFNGNQQVFTSGQPYTWSIDVLPTGIVDDFYFESPNSTSFPTTAGGWGVPHYKYSTNTWSSQGTGVTCTAQVLSNGWRRLHLTMTAAATFTSNAFGALYLIQYGAGVGDGVSGAYLTNAQLTNSASPLPYIPTGASSVTMPIETAEFSPMVEAIGCRPVWTMVARGQGISITPTDTGRIIGGPTAGNPTPIGKGAGLISQFTAWTGTASVSCTAGSGNLSGTFGAATAADSSGSSVSLNGGAVVSSTAAVFTTGLLSKLFLARGEQVAANPAYGDGFYDEVVMYAAKLTSAQLQAQAVAYG